MSQSCDPLDEVLLVVLRLDALAGPSPLDAVNAAEAFKSLSLPDMTSSLSSEVASVAVETLDERESCRCLLLSELEALKGDDEKTPERRRCGVAPGGVARCCCCCCCC